MLSGGQRQRIAIARSIISNPKIEYSRCLDSVSNSAIRSLVSPETSPRHSSIIADNVVPIVTLVPHSISQSAEFLVIGLGFCYGSQLVASGEYSSQHFFTIFIAIVFGGQIAAQFFTWTTSITKATGAANYLLWLRTVPTNIRDTPENQGKATTGDALLVDLNDVEFNYRQRKAAQVLRGILLDVQPGTFAAFVGASGCGKSTIVYLIQRFYDPSSGRTVVNDEDTKQLSPSLYRRCMSLLQQEPPLYMDSVRQNVALGLDYNTSPTSRCCARCNSQKAPIVT